MKKPTLLLCFALFAAKLSFAQTGLDTSKLIDHAFDRYYPQKPGCQFAILRNGKIIYSKAWGMADLERNVPLTTHSVIEVGSVSKQFTAAAILLLEQQNKLSLDDNIRKYVPEMPDYGNPITLREMMHHTSGVRDWGAVVELTGWARTKKFYTNQDALEFIIQQKHLNNKPGGEFLYSNSNYNLFAIVVERVSGLTLAAFTKKYIFDPAGMTQTQWRDNPNRIVPDRAMAYRLLNLTATPDSTYEIDMPNEYAYGNGGLLTTAEDLLKWNNFYLSGKFGSPSLLPKQLKTEPLNSGAPNHYAAGLNVEKVMGWQNINHSGATASYAAYLESFPELNLSFAIVNNTSEFYIVEPVDKVRKILIPAKAEKNSPPIKGIKLHDAALERFAGTYISTLDGNPIKVTRKDGNLSIDDGTILIPISASVFQETLSLTDAQATSCWICS
jgi:CubicO group peptidase (beta-lactamase class C family)